MDVIVVHTLGFATPINVSNGKSYPFYGSVEDATNYFTFRVFSDVWFNCERRQQIAALADASSRIDRLNFIGQKADDSQFLEFPRYGQASVPSQIVNATYEVALMLLNGIDPDTEAGNLSTVTRGYGAMKTEYNRSFVPLHMRAGIPSQTAWNLIHPFLLTADTIVLSRV